MIQQNLHAGKTKHSTNFITVLVRKINRNIRYHSRNTKGQLFTRGITQTTVSRSQWASGPKSL